MNDLCICTSQHHHQFIIIISSSSSSNNNNPASRLGNRDVITMAQHGRSALEDMG